MSDRPRDFESLEEFCEFVIALILRMGGSLSTAYRCAAAFADDPTLAHLDQRTSS